MWHPKKNLDPFLSVFRHFFMSYFDLFGSIFEKSAMTDLPKVIVSICLVSYNICMIPHVWTSTFGLNLSGAWGVIKLNITNHSRYQHQESTMDFLQISEEMLCWNHYHNVTITILLQHVMMPCSIMVLRQKLVKFYFRHNPALILDNVPILITRPYLALSSKSTI